ncbi:hypothetical protein B0F90DRAFT_1622599 [Multifurca ochricompacta]|uniref:MutL C-terminal dimerisation domain-containing protein n=1 Tax=Multifurca ochricompacta TaxID=376703 RepID=A0AAD4MBU5_9AGAM|nr:hypothetical protein B0F90DRAFT_1622599 [Multifurca ochricompacta]
MDTLKTLSETVRTRLRSTQIMTSLSQVVSELVQNSLDASASHIDIGLDCHEWECWVKDDGHGMSRSGLDALSRGHEAGRYNTSKAYNISSLGEVNTFGFRGEALASAADVSCLEISSRTASSPQTWSAITKNGHCLYNGPATRWRMERPGTVVYLRDIFHNLPIRRNSHTRPSKTIEIICRDIETLALAFPGVSFTVSTVRQPTKIGSHTDRVLNIPKVFGTHLSEFGSPIYLSVSITHSHTSLMVWLDINRHPLPSSHHLHRTIDHIFSSSNFSKQVRTLFTDTRRSPRKFDRKPIYVLSLKISPKDIANSVEARDSLLHVSSEDSITAFVDSVVHTFLLRHRFLLNNDGSLTPKKRQKVMAGNISRSACNIPAYQWTLSSEALVSSNAPSITRERDKAPSLYITWADPDSSVTFVVDKRTGHSYPRTSSSCAVYESNTQVVNLARRTSTVADFCNNEGEAPQWILDALQVAYLVKERPIPSVSQKLPNILSFSHVTHGVDVTHSDLLAHGSSSFTSDEASTWYLQRDDLARMKVINQLDKKFIVCAVDPLGERECDRQASDNPKRLLVLVDQHAASERVRVEGFLRTMCHYFLHPESTGSQSEFRVQLDPPRLILLSRKEASMLRGSARSILERWGFDLSWPESHDQSADQEQDAYGKVIVHSLPQVVSEKLLPGDELRDFLRRQVAGSENNDVLPALGSEMHETGQNHLTWHKALRWCPRDLLELVNSRACRGAIMFNDPLSIEQCERLISQLTETVFPFQCAHGRLVRPLGSGASYPDAMFCFLLYNISAFRRPSLVPLTGTSELLLRQSRRREVDWVRSGLTLAPSDDVD